MRYGYVKRELDPGLVVAVMGFVVIFGVMGFLLFDTIKGNRFVECGVDAHRYVPAHTETTWSTDSDGNTTWDHTDYPEEFRILCSESQGEKRYDINVGRERYERITNGQPVTVKAREGRYTGWHYLPSIE